MNKKLSILLPVFNEAPYIDQCIQSILINKSQDFELIISDNHSDDGTWEKIHEYRDGRIKIVRPSKRVVPIDNWWNAFDNSCGEYIYFFGGDDYLSDKVLDEIVPILRDEKVYIAPMVYFDDQTSEPIEYLSTKDFLSQTIFKDNKFVKNYLKNFNHDELILSFIPKKVLNSCRMLSKDSWESYTWWMAVLVFSELAHEYLSMTVLYKRYNKIHALRNSMEEFKGTSRFVHFQKSSGSLCNAFRVSRSLSAYSLLFFLLFLNRYHSSAKGGFFAKARRNTLAYLPGPIFMLFLSPFLMFLRFFKNK